ncbi:hypothetical protein [Mycolicibacterium sp.]|nr:hypothetical protein [Mycolicibacterium sp.]
MTAAHHTEYDTDPPNPPSQRVMAVGGAAAVDTKYVRLQSG